MVSRQVSGTFACGGDRKGQICCRPRPKGDKDLGRGWGRVLNPKAQPCPATGLKERGWYLLATPANAYTRSGRLWTHFVHELI